MSTDALVKDELFDQVLEDDRAAALQEWRQREEVVIDTAERS